MTFMKRLAVGVLAAALLAPGAGAVLLAPGADAAHHDPKYGMPRAMPADYAAAQGVLARAMPADYARAGVRLTPQAGMPRPTPSDYDAYLGSQRKPVSGLDWPSAGIGAAITLGALLAAALAVMLIRRNDRMRRMPA